LAVTCGEDRVVIRLAKKRSARYPAVDCGAQRAQNLIDRFRFRLGGSHKVLVVEQVRHQNTLVIQETALACAR
jgi:hypothetical protein